VRKLDRESRPCSPKGYDPTTESISLSIAGRCVTIVPCTAASRLDQWMMLVLDDTDRSRMGIVILVGKFSFEIIASSSLPSRAAWIPSVVRRACLTVSHS